MNEIEKTREELIDRRKNVIRNRDINVENERLHDIWNDTVEVIETKLNYFNLGVQLAQKQDRQEFLDFLDIERKTLLQDLGIDGLSENYQKELSIKISLLNTLQQQLKDKDGEISQNTSDIDGSKR